MVCIYSITLLSRIPQTQDVTFLWFVFITTLYYHVHLKHRMLPFYGLYLFNNSIITYTSNTGCYLSMVCIYYYSLLSRTPQTQDVTFLWFVFIQ